MAFRVKIISPLKASKVDIARRQRRYADHAQEGTEITVFNLDQGPVALNTSGDILTSANSIFEVGRSTSSAEYDAILIDCVFDPAVEEIREETGLPTFGPTRVTLPLVKIVASSFSIIARTERQCELLEQIVAGYGYGKMIKSLRPLGIAYEEAKQPEIFKRVMGEKLRLVAEQDHAGAVVFGSTTMAHDETMIEASGGIPLFMPGMVALRVIEHLWNDRLWPSRYAIKAEVEINKGLNL